MSMLLSEPTTFDRRRWTASALARYLTGRRVKLQMSIEQAAELSGMSAEEWQQLEAGRVPEDWKSYEAIARTMQTDAASIALVALFAAHAQ